MRALLLLVVAVLLVPCSAIAGEIFGTIRDSKGPVRGADVKIECDGQEPHTGKTDKYGGYSISVPTQGTCTLYVLGHKRTVRSFRQPAKFDVNIK